MLILTKKLKQTVKLYRLLILVSTKKGKITFKITPFENQVLSMLLQLFMQRTTIKKETSHIGI